MIDGILEGLSDCIAALVAAGETEDARDAGLGTALQRRHTHRASMNDIAAWKHEVHKQTILKIVNKYMKSPCFNGTSSKNKTSGLDGGISGNTKPQLRTASLLGLP